MELHAPSVGRDVIDSVSPPIPLKDQMPPGLGDMISGIVGDNVMEMDHPGDADSIEAIPDLVELLPPDLVVLYLLDQNRNALSDRCHRN